jgi:peptide/nickel transport system ATP-binding protein
MTVFDIIREPLIIHKIGDKSDHKEKVAYMMEQVGLDPRFLNRYPHSFSGGQRQRISLARSLTLNPDLLILDEPASALDVSIQAQILNLLKDMQNDFGLTYLFISHNLAVVDYIADRLLVMCKGKIVESAPREVLFSNPIHHYTKSLMSAVPYADLNRKLDFKKITQTEATDPATWPKPYAFSPGQRMEMISLGDDHFVLAEPGTSQADIWEA